MKYFKRATLLLSKQKKLIEKVRSVEMALKNNDIER